MESVALIGTLTALLCGPALYRLGQRLPPFLVFLDGFVVVSVAGLVLFEVMPDSISAGGIASIGFLLLGAIGPGLVERGLYQARREAHLATLALAVFGLLLHSLADGAALASGHGHHHHGHEASSPALGLAIVVHSIPVGLVVWWLMAPVFGWRLPALTLFLMAAATVSGYVFGLDLEAQIGGQMLAWFQALVAGSILHVVFGRPHLEEDSGFRKTRPPFEGLGNLAALIGLFLLHWIEGAEGLVDQIAQNVWNSLGLISPWFLLAGLALLVNQRMAGQRHALILSLCGFALCATLLDYWIAGIWLLLQGLMVWLSTQVLRSSAIKPEQAESGPLHWLASFAPGFLFGLGLGTLLSSIWPQTGLQFPGLVLQILLAAMVPMLLGWKVWLTLPLAAALGPVGLEPSGQLALIVASSLEKPLLHKEKLVRMGTAVFAGLVIWQLPQLDAGQLAFPKLPALASLLVLLLFGVSLLVSGGRRWARALGGFSMAHRH